MENSFNYPDFEVKRALLDAATIQSLVVYRPILYSGLQRNEEVSNAK